MCYKCGHKMYGRDRIWLERDHALPYCWYTHPPHERQADTQISTEFSWTSALSILCNECWLELWTPQKRWPYYDRWAVDQNFSSSKQFVIEQNLYEDYTYDEKLILAVGSPVIAHPNYRFGFVDSINNFTVTIALEPVNTYGRHTIAKSEFDSYYTRTGMDKRLYEQACNRDTLNRVRSVCTH